MFVWAVFCDSQGVWLPALLCILLLQGSSLNLIALQPLLQMLQQN